MLLHSRVAISSQSLVLTQVEQPTVFRIQKIDNDRKMDNAKFFIYHEAEVLFCNASVCNAPVYHEAGVSLCFFRDEQLPRLYHEAGVSLCFFRNEQLPRLYHEAGVSLCFFRDGRPALGARDSLLLATPFKNIKEPPASRA